MPYRTEVINQGTGILRYGSGILTGAEMIASARANKAAEIDWTRISHFVLDLTEVTRFDVSASDIDQLVSAAKKNSDILAEVHHLAIAAPSDVAYGMSRMFQAYQALPDLVIQVFRGRAEADAWLQSVLEVPKS
ncbi:MAG: hypothetical protein HY014_10465 [Acidobacteria bacterium]|nr:hypothetical protein [Acidobacteriota bacterium]MBI3488577.1 hypothetical protein [Acidobacteriota bacterium]